MEDPLCFVTLSTVAPLVVSTETPKSRRLEDWHIAIIFGSIGLAITVVVNAIRIYCMYRKSRNYAAVPFGADVEAAGLMSYPPFSFR